MDDLVLAELRDAIDGLRAATERAAEVQAAAVIYACGNLQGYMSADAAAAQARAIVVYVGAHAGRKADERAAEGQ